MSNQEPNPETGIKSLTPFMSGVREAIGIPALVMIASFLGFGSLVRGSDLSLWFGLASTVTTWALPGQIAQIEMYALGASMFVVTLAIWLVNARLLPMTLTLYPMLRDPSVPKWAYYVASHYVAVTGWVACMKRCPELPPADRFPYFLGFCTVLWAASVVATAVGWLMVDQVPRPVSLALIAFNPLYFLLVLVSDLRVRARVFALGLGGIMGPLVHLLTPDWGLLITGVAAGTAAFVLDRALKKTGTLGGDGRS